MRRSALLRILVPFLVVLHLLLHVGLGLAGSAPDLLLVALLLAAREVGMGWGAGLGLFFGLLEDSFSVLAFGANGLALTLLGVVGARTRDLFVGDSTVFYFWYLAAGKLLRDLVFWVVAGGGVREPFVSAILLEGSVAAVYAALVGVILILPFLGRNPLP